MKFTLKLLLFIYCFSVISGFGLDLEIDGETYENVKLRPTKYPALVKLYYDGGSKLIPIKRLPGITFVTKDGTTYKDAAITSLSSKRVGLSCNGELKGLKIKDLDKKTRRYFPRKMKVKRYKSNKSETAKMTEKGKTPSISLKKKLNDEYIGFRLKVLFKLLMTGRRIPAAEFKEPEMLYGKAVEKKIPLSQETHAVNGACLLIDNGADMHMVSRCLDNCRKNNNYEKLIELGKIAALMGKLNCNHRAMITRPEVNLILGANDHILTDSDWEKIKTAINRNWEERIRDTIVNNNNRDLRLTLARLLKEDLAMNKKIGKQFPATKWRSSKLLNLHDISTKTGGKGKASHSVKIGSEKDVANIVSLFKKDKDLAYAKIDGMDLCILAANISKSKSKDELVKYIKEIKKTENKETLLSTSEKLNQLIQNHN